MTPLSVSLYSRHSHSFFSIPFFKRFSSHSHSLITPIIGLEVHVQLDTSFKLFSPDTLYSSFSLFDMGFPGQLPMLNNDCVDIAIKASLILNFSTINSIIWFDRKHYKWRDLPHGFQITQHDQPIALNGRIDNLALERLQLEMVTLNYSLKIIPFCILNSLY